MTQTWTWANKYAGWRVIKGLSYDVDVIKNPGNNGYVVELRRHGEIKRSYDRVTDYSALKSALLFAQDYSLYINDRTNQVVEPKGYDDKYYA